VLQSRGLYNMDYLNNNSVYSGTKLAKLPERTRVKLKTSGPITIFGTDENGTRLGIIAAGVIGNYLFIQKGYDYVEIQADKKTNWQIEYATPDLYQEHLDPEPIAIPLGKQELSTDQKIKELVRIEMSKLSEEAGNETFDEANDFDIDDDEDMLSGFEVREMQQEVPFQEYVEKNKKEKNTEKNPSPPPTGDPESED
jgi:hypothetical protein